MLGPDDLVLCAGTLPSGIPFRDRVEAAAAVGFSAITLCGPDLARARREGLSDRAMRRLLDDAGVSVGELDSVWTWAPGTEGIAVADDENPDGYGASRRTSRRRARSSARRAAEATRTLISAAEASAC